MEHIELTEAKAEVYTKFKAPNMVDDDQLTLEEAFGLKTKQDTTATIDDENIQTPKDRLNILQWNVFHLTKKSIKSLYDIAQQEQIDVICIQEMTDVNFPKAPPP